MIRKMADDARSSQRERLKAPFFIWNTSYDGILRMEMPDCCFLIGYADDVAALISARDVEDAQMRLGQVMCRVRRWLVDDGLETSDGED